MNHKGAQRTGEKSPEGINKSGQKAWAKMSISQNPGKFCEMLLKKRALPCSIPRF
jgi:hypothetical protein